VLYFLDNAIPDQEVKSDENTFSCTLRLTFFFCPFFLMQLYELDSDPKRKEFLDDLFSFMQKRGMCKENHPFPSQKHLRMTSYRVLYHSGLSKVSPYALRSTPSSSFYVYFMSKLCSFLCLYHAEIGLWLPHSCVIINVGVLTHVHVMIGLGTAEACVPIYIYINPLHQLWKMFSNSC